MADAGFAGEVGLGQLAIAVSCLTVQQAVHSFAKWVANNIGGTVTKQVLDKLLDEPGVRLATHVTRAIANTPRNRSSESMLEVLGSHRSAIVRSHVREIKARWTIDD